VLRDPGDPGSVRFIRRPRHDAWRWRRGARRRHAGAEGGAVGRPAGLRRGRALPRARRTARPDERVGRGRARRGAEAARRVRRGPGGLRARAGAPSLVPTRGRDPGSAPGPPGPRRRGDATPGGGRRALRERERHRGAARAPARGRPLPGGRRDRGATRRPPAARRRGHEAVGGGSPLGDGLLPGRSSRRDRARSEVAAPLLRARRRPPRGAARVGEARGAAGRVHPPAPPHLRPRDARRAVRVLRPRGRAPRDRRGHLLRRDGRARPAALGRGARVHRARVHGHLGGNARPGGPRPALRPGHRRARELPPAGRRRLRRRAGW
jgi:hypothetical protein